MPPIRRKIPHSTRRKTNSRGDRTMTESPSTEPTTAEIREWAQKNTDLQVGARGRLSAEVREAYDAAHQG